MSKTERVSIRLKKGLWPEFIDFVAKKRHRTHGGVVGQEASEALEAWMKENVSEE